MWPSRRRCSALPAAPHRSELGGANHKIAASEKLLGRQSYRAEVVALAQLLRKSGMTLRAISAELASRGYLTGRGKPYVASAVRAMLA